MSVRIFAAAGAVCVAAAAAYFFYPKAPLFTGQGTGAIEMPAPGFAAASGSTTGAGPLKPARTPPAGHAEYRNERYRFALFYPSNLSVKSFDEGGGASTIALQDVGRAEGFQIFVVPYEEAQVSEARFRRDVPSGVREGLLGITIGGAAATSFYSANALLGDTAEIWFIYGGYLFEVTAPKSQAVWLSGIMATWQFI
jgi:hypothetical protein